jgi:hypothetical protein
MPQWADGPKWSGTGVVVLERYRVAEFVPNGSLSGIRGLHGTFALLLRTDVNPAYKLSRALGEEEREIPTEKTHCFCFAGNVPLRAVLPLSSRKVTLLACPLFTGMFFSQSE